MSRVYDVPIVHDSSSLFNSNGSALHNGNAIRSCCELYG